MFVPREFFQDGNLFVGKSAAHPSETPISTLGKAPGPAHQTQEKKLKGLPEVNTLAYNENA